MKSILCILSLVLVLINPMSVLASDSQVGYIFIGDSRTVGMQNAVANEIGDNVYFVAKVGAGYKWLVSDAIDEVDNIISENGNVNNWKIITNFGVNDLGNAQRYLAKYEELLKNEWSGHELYFVSVNPVNEAKCSSVSNCAINEFNKVFIGESTYINVYDILTEMDLKSRDGLHYGNSVNKYIFQEIMAKVQD